MASRTDILTELNALSAHYMRIVRSPEEQERILSDYADDLKAFDLDAIKNGCRSWRQSSAQRFPTPGQLIPMIRANMRQQTGPRPAAWKPCTTEEYEAMPPYEQIRELQCRMEAINPGPQFSQVQQRHLDASEMPEEWHKARQRIATYAAEIKRIRMNLRKEA